MSKQSPSLHVILVVLIVVIALIIAAQSFQRLSFYQKQIQHRKTELAELRQLAGRLRGQNAEDAVLVSSAGDAQRLEAILARVLAGKKVDVSLRETVPVGVHMNLRRYQVRLEDIAPEKLSAALAAFENAQPPIRLVDIQLTAGQDHPSAQLTLAEISAATLHSAP